MRSIGVLNLLKISEQEHVCSVGIIIVAMMPKKPRGHIQAASSGCMVV